MKKSLFPDTTIPTIRQDSGVSDVYFVPFSVTVLVQTRYSWPCRTWQQSSPLWVDGQVHLFRSLVAKSGTIIWCPVFNLLVPHWRCDCNLRLVIFKLISKIDICSVCPEVNATEHHWWLPVVNIVAGNGMVPSGNKPLPEPTLTKWYDTIQCQWASMRLVRSLQLICWLPINEIFGCLIFNCVAKTWLHDRVPVAPFTNMV